MNQLIAIQYAIATNPNGARATGIALNAVIRLKLTLPSFQKLPALRGIRVIPVGCARNNRPIRRWASSCRITPVRFQSDNKKTPDELARRSKATRAMNSTMPQRCHPGCCAIAVGTGISILISIAVRRGDFSLPGSTFCSACYGACCPSPLRSGVLCLLCFHLELRWLGFMRQPEGWNKQKSQVILVASSGGRVQFYESLGINLIRCLFVK